MKSFTSLHLIKELSAFTSAMSRVTTLEELAFLNKEIVSSLFTFDYAGLYLFDKDEARLRLVMSLGFTEEEERMAEATAMERHPGRVFREKREYTFSYPDSRTDDQNGDIPRVKKIRSRIYFPVMNHTECVGAFGISSSKKDNFSEEEIELLRFITGLTGVVYANLHHRKVRQLIMEDLRLKEQAIESAQNGVIITNPQLPDNPMIYANKAFYLMTGYTKEDVIGKNCRFLQGEDKDQHGLSVLRSAIREKKGCVVELKNFRKDGTPFWNELRINPLFDDKGAITNFIGVQTDITKRVLAEKELKEYGTRIASLLGNIPSGILVEDEHGKIVLANESFCQIFGLSFTPAELVGMECTEAFSQAGHIFRDPDEVAMGIQRTLTERKLKKGELITFADGRYFERVYVPIMIEGDYRGHLWLYDDITERKRYEDTLMQAKEHSQSIVAALPELLFVVSRKGFIEDYKDAENELLIKPRDFLYKHYSESPSPELAGVIENTIEEIRRSGGPAEIEFSMLVNGETRYFSGKGRPFAQEGYIIILRNITSQKNIEREILAHNRFQSILMRISSEYINIPLTEVDAKINESLERIGRFTGADRSYIFTYDFESRTTSNTYEWCETGIVPQIKNLQNLPMELFPEWIEAHTKGEPMIISNVHLLDDSTRLKEILGSQGIQSLIAIPMTAEGKPIGFVGFDWVKHLHEITELEGKLLAVFAQLLVNISLRREAELLLKIEKENAQASNKALSEFAYIASHDLREPLRKVSAFGSLLNKSLAGRLDEDEMENLDYMIEGVKRMQQMVDDLLQYSRLTAKAKSSELINLDELLLEIIHFDLAQIIEDTYAVISLENTMGFLRGEKTQLKQLFQNLIGNGIKYRRKDVPPVVTIRSKRDGGYLTVEIEDNGIGIDAKYKNQIFEMFKRLHSKEKYEGSGIGLAICKKIVENYRGEIEVESEPEKGSVFSIKIPVKE